MDQTTISVISAIGGIIAAVAGLLAAGAAYRSAGIAKDAAKHVQMVEHRELVRSILSTFQNIVADTMRVDDLANNLKLGYRGLSIRSGLSGGSTLKLHTTDVEAKQQSIINFQQDAHQYLQDIPSVRGLSEEDLTNLLVTNEGYLTQIRRVKNKFELDLASIDTEN